MSGGVARIKLKIVPGAASTSIVGWLGDAFKIRVTAAPEKGRANAAIESLLAKSLGLAPGAVRIVAGHGAPRKVVEIEGLSEDDVRVRIARD